MAGAGRIKAGAEIAFIAMGVVGPGAAVVAFAIVLVLAVASVGAGTV